MRTWNHISKPFNREIHEALLQQHHAVQFLVMAAKVYIPEKEDDSHTNLGFNSNLNALVTHPFLKGNSIRLGIRLTDLSMLLLDADNRIRNEFSLHGKTRNEVFNELAEFLQTNLQSTRELSPELHYKIPDHSIHHAGKFDVRNLPSFTENLKYRHNADLALKAVSQRNASASEIRVWPHHFDSGGVIALAFDRNKKLARSIGIGFAIPDFKVNEPYFYLSFWSSDSRVQLVETPCFSGKGKWKIPEWQGAVFTLTDLIDLPDPETQFMEVINFFEEGIHFLKKPS